MSKDVYRYKTRPYVHQVKALKKLLSTGWGGALLMEPRTGKTKVAIDYASVLYSAGKVNRVLVVCPAGILGVWEEEIPRHCPVPYRITVWDRRRRRRDKKRGISSLPRFGKDVLDFVLVNYDAASVAGDLHTITRGPRKGQVVRARRGGRYAFKQKILDWQPHLVMLDESHRIKSPSAKKSKVFHDIGAIAKYRVIMTGTVVTKRKRIFDVFSQWKFLNRKRFVDSTGMPMTFEEFKAHYSQTTTRNGYPQWLKNKNEAELHKLIHKDAYSVLREDCFDMPKLTPQVIPVELDESLEAYEQMANDMVARIKTGEITEASIALVQGLRLRQMSGGVAKVNGDAENPKGHLRIIGSEKLRVLEDRLEDLMEAGEHVIIGASFRADIQRIEKLCRRRKWKHFVVQGGVKLPERHRMRREFEAAEEGAIFIGNPAAASEGIDLRSAAIMIWYSLTNSWVHYRQFMDRNALHAGPRAVEYLLAGGADFLQYESLLEDGDMGKKMITSPERLLESGAYHGDVGF